MKKNIKCILNVIIEIISLKVINLIKLIKICFDLNYFNFSIFYKGLFLKVLLVSMVKIYMYIGEKLFYYFYL